MPSHSSKQKSSFVIKTYQKEGNTKKIASLEHLGTLLAENRKATHKHRAFYLTTASVLAGKQTLSHFWRERKRCFSFDGNANACVSLAGTKTLHQFWRERFVWSYACKIIISRTISL